MKVILYEALNFLAFVFTFAVCVVFFYRVLLPPLLRWVFKSLKMVPVLLVPLASFGGVQFTAIAISTNRPDFDFTAAGGSTAYWHSSNDCHSVTFTVSGDIGVYDLQWDYDLLPRYTNSSGAIVGHGWLNVYPPITNQTGTVTVTFPAKPSPESYWRLKQR